MSKFHFESAEASFWASDRTRQILLGVNMLKDNFFSKLYYLSHSLLYELGVILEQLFFLLLRQVVARFLENPFWQNLE